MPPLSNPRRPIGRQKPTPARGKKAPTTGTAPAAIDPVMARARRDIDAGLVDTDMRATPGLDAQRRARLVPGPGRQPPTLDRPESGAVDAPPSGKRPRRMRGL